MIEIYKASAGSGKTYNLTLRYLILLLGEKRGDGSYRLRTNQRNAHRSILAITFTNKATEEMKRRIIHELAVLADMEPNWTEPSPYMQSLRETFNLSEDDDEKLKKAARKALKSLLYDFNYFNVSTIDSFFQVVLRTFAREAELMGNFELELDRRFAINTSIAGMLSDVSQEDAETSRNSSRMDWIVEYMERLALEGRDFNVFNRTSMLYRELVTLVDAMLDEEYAEKAEVLREYLKDPSLIKEFTQGIVSHIAGLKEKAKHDSKALDDHIKLEGNSVLLDVLKVRFLDAISGWSVNGWNPTGKGALQAEVKSGADDVSTIFKSTEMRKLKPDETLIEKTKILAAKACKSIKECYTSSIFLKTTISNIFMVGLLGDVLKKLGEYCNENNLFLLSNTNELLRHIIGDDDVPFIYERIGLWLNHFLIDEFQDTSRMQWQNIVPLLKESLASDHDNLIIGDEKQCIYRFRNSDPELLHTGVKADFQHHSFTTGDTVSANTNWRSSAEVVRFNNTLFTALGPMLNGGDVYDNVVQQVASKHLDHKGYVKVTNINKDFKDATLVTLENELRRQLKTYKPCEIAILTRERRDARKVIDFILGLTNNPDSGFPRINVISDDSLEIAKSTAVRFIVSVLRYLVAPDNTTSERNVSERRVAAIINNFEHTLSRDSSLSSEEALQKAIEANISAVETLADEYRHMKSPSLVSLVERIIHDYVTPDARASENMFISAFTDIVNDFCERGDGDIQSFLHWWDETGCSTTVSSPEDENAIRVMTIHKSKGLEFRCVHIPYADWEFKKDKDIKWFSLEKEWFPMVRPEVVPPMLPLRRQGSMADNHYAPHYNQLVKEQETDELNTVYVAFTRAIEELIVQCETKATNSIGTKIWEAIKSVTPEFLDKQREAIGKKLPQGAPETLTPFTITDNVCTVGEPTVAVQLPEKQSTILEADGSEGLIMPDYSTHERSDIWAQMALDRDDDEIDKKDLSPHDPRFRGIVLHNIMGNVYHIGDIPAATRRMKARKLLDADKVDETIDLLTAQASLDVARPWFEGYKRVLLERPIVADDDTWRPDRVVWTAQGTVDVIDYKTGSPHPGYASQVRGYMHLLEKAGHSGVRGFLWYLDTGEIVPVAPR